MQFRKTTLINILQLLLIQDNSDSLCINAYVKKELPSHFNKHFGLVDPNANRIGKHNVPLEDIAAPYHDPFEKKPDDLIQKEPSDKIHQEDISNKDVLSDH